MASYCLLWDNHAENLYLNLSNLFENQQQLDIFLNCDNQTIGVHKCVLMAGSNYFKEQLNKNTDATHISIKNIPFRVLKSLLEFIYKGEITVEKDDIYALLVAAKFFIITGLTGLNCNDFNLSEVSDRNFSIEEPEFSNKKIYSDKSISTENVSIQKTVPEFGITVNAQNNFISLVKSEYIEIDGNNKNNEINKDVSPVTEMSAELYGDTVQQKTPSEEEQFEDEEYLEENLSEIESSILETDISLKDSCETNDKQIKVLQEIGIPTDLPVFVEGSDGKYVELSKDLLEDIADGSQVIYQVVDENGKASELLLGTTAKKMHPSLQTDNIYDEVTVKTLPLQEEAQENLTLINKDKSNVDSKMQERIIRNRKLHPHDYGSRTFSPIFIQRRKVKLKSLEEEEQHFIEKINNRPTSSESILTMKCPENHYVETLSEEMVHDGLLKVLNASSQFVKKKRKLLNDNTIEITDVSERSMNI